MKILGIIFLLGTSLLGCNQKNGPDQQLLQRYAMVIKVKPQKLEEYKALHSDVWPGVLSTLKNCNIQNYSIHLKDSFLFGYLEYTGLDFDADMEKMAADSITQAWWKLTDPCQTPFESRQEGEWWALMEEVFYME